MRDKQTPEKAKEAEPEITSNKNHKTPVEYVKNSMVICSTIQKLDSCELLTY